jgi:N-acetylneuraminic acid mutarotase
MYSLHKLLDLFLFLTIVILPKKFDHFQPGYSTVIYGNVNRDCYQYNVTADKWSKIATSVYNHQNNPATIYQDKIYIFDNSNANPEAYDLVAKTWNRGLSTPTAIGNGACIVKLRDSILVLGGDAYR